MGQFINIKKKLNKLLCILLSILLISLSICPVFADSYTYSNATSFCTAINSVVTWQGNSYISSNSLFIDSLPTEFNLAYQYVLSYYDIDINDVWYVQLQRTSSTNYCVTVFSSPYTYVVGGYPERLTGNYCPYLSLYTNVSGTLYKSSVTYSTANNTYVAVTQTLDNGSTGMGGNPKNNQLSYFAGIYPVKLVISPNNSYTDFYTLDPNYNPGGGGDNPSYTFESITMNKPPTAYVALATAFYNQAVNHARDEFPTVYANVPAGKLLIDDYNLFALGELIMANTGVFESYAAHSYDFYDNVSENLANGMTAITQAMSNMQDIADNIELLASVYASDQEIEAREAAADNQQAVVDNFLDSQGDGSVSDSDIGELADSSAEIKSNFNTGYSASGVWDVFDRNWDWFSNTTKNNLEPPAQNTRSANDYETPFLDNAINEILHLRGN